MREEMKLTNSKKIWKKIIVLLLAVCFVCSLGVNFFLNSKYVKMEQMLQSDMGIINFPDTNSRDTYFSIHNLKTAQDAGKGEGVRVGILDWGFGYAENEELYAGGKDFCTWEYHDEDFNRSEEHGFWMAQTLKEIAPEAEIYALGTYTPNNEDEWVDKMIEAVEWAMEEKLDILTLSHEAVSEKNRKRFDEAVDRAVAQGIVTTFIHYDNPNNILPWGIWNSGGDGYYKRDADINIFQYDYNTLFTESYREFQQRQAPDSDYKSELFLSVSSMSVVTAGFVAILESINDTLTPAQYKEILVNTSRPMEYENERAEHVVDMGEAVRYLTENY